MKEENRRQRDRVQNLRAIVYVYENSDKFIDATMINHSPNGICFQSALSVKPGSKICIMSDDCPIEAFFNKPGEGLTAEVMWCEQKAGAHRVGVQYVDNSDSEDDEV